MRARASLIAHVARGLCADVAAKKAAYGAACDAQLLLGSSIWTDTLVGYQHIKVAARMDGGLQTALGPLERFMKPRLARRKAPVAT